MKLVCSVCVGNRLLPVLAVNTKRRHVKSTIALCKTPNSSNFCILLFSGQNKTGTKYAIRDNIIQVLTRFLNEGKVTIKFKEPQHDLYIQADSIQLKSFLHLLKLIIQNKMDETDLKVSSVGVTPVNLKNHAPKTLTITKASEYPVKGLPRTLEELHINDINKCSLNRGIWQLAKLKILDLSHNCIEFLPPEVKNMPSLSELNLSHNELGTSSLRQWNWIGGHLSKNLKLLNLSNNKLRYLPLHISKLYSLIILNVDNNELKELPSGIGCLQNLKTLTASNNLLTYLPGSMKNLQIRDLDLSNNQFVVEHLNNPINISVKHLPMSSLKELSAQKFLALKVPYASDMLPLTLCDYLDLAKFCICGNACFNTYIRQNILLRLNSIAEKVSISLNGITTVPIECWFCSLKCSNSIKLRRQRSCII
ncbi:leucine-rich repeat protein 1 [Agrilus planipennis]|uniref:Leucine-rich repeat protein 1 n=1 Tax=Agrilus planipennis TaxID=224129 RepID=A0A1W4WA27_AGRPL|nr:leucine-rich repeat protein 1 [Agrilus planipennis]